MPVIDRPDVKGDVTVWAGVKQAPASRNVDIVLKPISRPDLGDIRVDATVFAIGRTDPPFESYGNDVLNMLSRRHASLFRKEGFVYLVDLQSRNGTTVNRVGIGHEPCQLRDQDEICFGGSLSYRIQITPRVRPEGSLTLMLTPELGGVGLETIVVSKFPFLVSKTDGIFAHYRTDDAHEAELKYLSRRHAHIFVKSDQAYISDLGSANGTFIDGQRLQEQAVLLQDGAVVAFGGKHFVYKVGMVRETGLEPSDLETRQHHLTEQRIQIQRDALPPQIKPQANVKPQAVVIAKADIVAPPAPAAAPVAPAPESKPRWSLFGRKQAPAKADAETRASPVLTPQASVSAKADSEARTALSPVLNGKPQAAGDSKPSAAATPSAAAKPLAAPAAAPVNKPVASAKPEGGLFGAARAKSEADSLTVAGAKTAASSSAAAGQKAANNSAAAAGAKVDGKSSAAAGAKPAAAVSATPDKKSSSATLNGAAAQAPKADATPPAQSQTPADLNSLAMDSGTQFMAAGTTFLTVLCAADSPKKEATPDPAAAEAAAKEANAKRRPRGRVMLLLSELVTLLKGEQDGKKNKTGRYVALGAAVIVALVTTAYVWNANERAFKEAITRNDYPRAATLAVRLLDKHPDDIELRAKATDVGLKATVPAWLDKIRAHDFDGAKTVLTGAADLSKRDSDLRPMIDELQWLGDLERLVSVRGGPEAPVRIYGDEDSIERVISRWNEDTGEHQRALSRIASYVPQFVDWYGEALTHLRRLQSESSVYLPVVERVKTNIATELARDNPDVLKPALKEIADKYPRLGGIDVVRQDLTRYIEIRHEARSRKSGRLFALLEKAHFVTPPFQQSFRALVDSGQLPPSDVLHQYNAATRSWKERSPADSLPELQKLTTGPWGEYLSRELQRRQGIAAGFEAVQTDHNNPDYVDRLLAFRESLDADEDVYFVHATAADLTQQRAKVIERAETAMSQARTSWQEYRNEGAIDASQRIETTVSDGFRTRAHSLSEASKYAQQAFRLYSQVDAQGATQWSAIRDEIETEVNEQRSRLRDLSNVVEPALLNTKLTLLGDANE